MEDSYYKMHHLVKRVVGWIPLAYLWRLESDRTSPCFATRLYEHLLFPLWMRKPSTGKYFLEETVTVWTNIGSRTKQYHQSTCDLSSFWIWNWNVWGWTRPCSKKGNLWIHKLEKSWLTAHLKWSWRNNLERIYNSVNTFHQKLQVIEIQVTRWRISQCLQSHGMQNVIRNWFLGCISWPFAYIFGHS